MAAPPFNDEDWITENYPGVEWLARIPKRRFAKNAPKGGGIVIWNDDKTVSVRLNRDKNGDIEWAGDPRAELRILYQAKNGDWRKPSYVLTDHGNGYDFDSIPVENLEGKIPPGTFVGILLNATVDNARTDTASVKYPDFSSDDNDEEDDDDDVTEPDSLLPTLEELRLNYPTPIMKSQLGQLLNEVAWKHRSLGWGLAAKSVGEYTTQPHTGTKVSRDLLIHQPTQLMYDVLQDVTNGVAKPMWGAPLDADLPWVGPVDPIGPNPDLPPEWPSEAPYPQLVYGPQVDRIHDKGVDHWVNLVEEHGFHGILIPCHLEPLDNTGIKALVEKVPFALIRLFGDEQRGQTPEGGLVGSVAQGYYADLFRLLGHLGPDRWAITAGFDVFEWADFAEIEEWVDMMKEMDTFSGRMIGARARTRADDPPNSVPNPGTYKPWALRVEDKSQLNSLVKQIIADSGDFPVCAEDGFRERFGPPDRPKDWNQEQTLKGLQEMMDAGCASTWMRCQEDKDDDGSIAWDDPGVVKEILSPGDPDPPDPPDPIGPPDIPEDEWGLVADLDQGWKASLLVNELPDIYWIRTQATPTRTGWNPEVAQTFFNVPTFFDYRVLVGLYDGPHELNPPHKWQQYAIDVGQILSDNGFKVWIVADIETGNPVHMPGGVLQYIDLWAGEVDVIGKLRDQGHKVMGPGMVHGNTAHFEQILDAIQFDAVSAHFYPDRGSEEHLGWMDDAEAIAREHGYEWGVSAETGANGYPETWTERYCPFDANAAQISRVRSLKADFDARPFWRLKMYYQILDDPTTETAQGKVGYGLFLDENDQDEVYESKPVITLFKS